MRLNVSNPGCYWIRFAPGVLPRYFELRDSLGRIYYFRYLDNFPRIKFNILHPDIYTSNVDFEVYKMSDIDIPDTYPVLPPPERDRWKENTEIVYNPDVKGTPVRIFTEEGRIECGDKFYDYPPVLRLFLLLHEQGHYFYLTEEYCDLWAMVNYLRMGYNRSMAYYALTHILSRNSANIKRIHQLFDNIQKTQKTKL